MKNPMTITVSNRQKNYPLSALAIKARLGKMLVYLQCPEDTELSVLITNDQGIARLNRQWLGRSGPANVLSFSQQEGELFIPGNNLLGDVVVSADTAWAEAQAHGLDWPEHLIRLIVHGLLHLLGYDHEQGGQEAEAMEQLTEELLQAIK
jgi:rRNA maturation RNase YbeY